MATVREGDRISNYLLEARVGTGSFGDVWRARHHVFPETVAIKIPTDPQYVRNLQREGVAVHGLRHPNIVRAIDVDPYADPAYLVMEYVDGPTLRAAIDHYRVKFPISAAEVILRGLLNALTAAHGAGLLHRDIKPANILLHHPLEDLATINVAAVKVTDFGLGQAGGMTRQTIMQSGSLDSEEGQRISGTLAYMSPEQREGKNIDGRSDLYSCGIVLFEMLTGERPQGNESPSALRPGIPPHLDNVFQRAYTRLDRRFQSAEEMLKALSPAVTPPPPPSIGHAKAATAPPIPAPMQARCPACAGEVHRDDQFCIHCGHQLAASVPRCPSCAAFVHSRDRFCIFCGANLQVLQG
ncbi:MAG: protein kinase [Phycisphaerae bacterium]|nr:protein kinase [Phycisphaerae bacterium]